MDSELFSAPYDTDPNWTIAKSFFRELVSTTRQKVRWPGDGDGGLGLGKEDREGFDSWRRDAGEVIVGAYVFPSFSCLTSTVKERELMVDITYLEMRCWGI